MLALFSITGALVFGSESLIPHDPGKTATSAVIILLGGYGVILDWINNRDTIRRAEDTEKRAAFSERARKRSERRLNRENAELRRQIDELKQHRNGSN